MSKYTIPDIAIDKILNFSDEVEYLVIVSDMKIPYPGYPDYEQKSFFAENTDYILQNILDRFFRRSFSRNVPNFGDFDHVDDIELAGDTDREFRFLKSKTYELVNFDMEAEFIPDVGREDDEFTYPFMFDYPQDISYDSIATLDSKEHLKEIVFQIAKDTFRDDMQDWVNGGENLDTLDQEGFLDCKIAIRLKKMNRAPLSKSFSQKKKKRSKKKMK